MTSDTRMCSRGYQIFGKVVQFGYFDIDRYYVAESMVTVEWVGATGPKPRMKLSVWGDAAGALTEFADVFSRINAHIDPLRMEQDQLIAILDACDFCDETEPTEIDPDRLRE